jgi:UDP-N-acetylmuramoylalanine--D-glutamate ligase
MLVPPGEIAVIGLGRSGVAATRLLLREGARVYASDLGADGPVADAAQGLRAVGAAVDLGGHDLARIGRAALAVVSPGVPPTAPPVAAARDAGVPVWAEAELGLRALGGAIPFIAVTGTNGKTTTTALVAHMLTAAGRRAVAAGNIGLPLSEVAQMSHRPQLLAVELSSFQLHDMPTVSPTVGVLTNLAPDHLDRYPNLDEYYRDKLRLFANGGPDSMWVTNADDPTSRQWIDQPRGRRRRFSVRNEADGWLDRASESLMLGTSRVVPRNRFPLLGDHNVANALAASLAVHAVGVTVDDIARGLASAAPLAHRMEPIREVGGVLWVNDSKATNISSTEVALQAIDRPFVLLLGGRHKGESYRRLAPLLDRCRAVVAYGEAGPLVEGDLGDAVELIRGTTFEQVVAAAAAVARPGDAVLLSPACSSYDMFRNYEERGATFRRLVEAL